MPGRLRARLVGETGRADSEPSLQGNARNSLGDAGKDGSSRHGMRNGVGGQFDLWSVDSEMPFYCSHTDLATIAVARIYRCKDEGM